MTTVIVTQRAVRGKKIGFFSKKSFFVRYQHTIIFVFLGMCASITVGRFVFSTFFGVKNTIGSIVFSDENMASYNDVYLYDFIQNLLFKQQYYSAIATQGGLLDKIRERFPLVRDITIDQIQDTKVAVDLVFYDPLFIIAGEKMRRGVLEDNTIFEIYSGSSLGSDRPVLTLPRYVSSTKTLAGYFFLYSARDLYRAITLVEESGIAHTSLSYLIGSDRLAIVRPDGTRLYFSLQKGITEQIVLFRHFFDNQAGFLSGTRLENYGQFDIGSIENALILSSW